MDILAGCKFGTLTAIELLDERTNKGERQWKVHCDVCGKESVKKSTDLRRGRINCFHCQLLHSMYAPVRGLYSNYKRNAEQRGKSFELTLEEFKHLVVQHCHYCNLRPFTTYRKPGMKFGITYNGLDRVDNSKDYVIDNVVPCCKFCNLAKKTYPVEEFRGWLDKIRSESVMQGDRNG